MINPRRTLWQKEEEADRDIAAGRLSGPFNSVAALQKHLKKLKKNRNLV